MEQLGQFDCSRLMFIKSKLKGLTFTAFDYAFDVQLQTLYATSIELVIFSAKSVLMNDQTQHDPSLESLYIFIISDTNSRYFDMHLLFARYISNECCHPRLPCELRCCRTSLRLVAS